MDKKERNDSEKIVLQKDNIKEKKLEPESKTGFKKDNASKAQEEKKNKKPMSEEGKRITRKIEKMTGIKLLEEDEVIHKECDNVDNSVCEKSSNTTAKPEKEGNETISKACANKTKRTTQKPSVDKKTSKEALQDVKDVDLGECDANKPLVFKCPNDLRVTLKKDNGEYVIDEDCCTAISILVKNSGEIATNFSGAHSPELVKILDKSLKKYLKELKKTLKKEYKTANDELTLSQETLDEEKKWDRLV